MVKRFAAILCAGLGVILLSFSAYASYDDADGYQSYKEAIKKLIFTERNLAGEFDASVYIDGKKCLSMSGEAELDGENCRIKEEEYADFVQKEIESYEYMFFKKGNNAYEINLKEKLCALYENAKNGIGTFSLPNFESDRAAKNIVRFAELTMDVFLGDVKNNVVCESENDGVKNYVLSLSGQQIPEVINTGFAFFGLQDFDNGYSTIHRDYDVAECAYYNKKTGENLSLDEYKSKRDDLKVKQISKEFEELTEQYDDENTKVIIVDRDATIRRYPTNTAAMKDPQNVGIYDIQDYLLGIFSKGLSPESVLNKFSIDENGMLRTSNLKALFDLTDDDGTKYKIEMIFNCKLKDYGTTKVELPDLSDYVKYVYDTERKTMVTENGKVEDDFSGIY